MAVGRFWRRYRGWIAAAVLVSIGVTVHFVWRGTKTVEAPTTYTASAVETGTIQVTVAGTGNLDVRDLVTVSPKTSGTIATLEVAEGDTVTAGDTLYVLEGDDAAKATAQAAAAKRQASSQVSQAEVSVLQAEQSLDKLESRTASDPEGVASDTEIEIGEKQVAIAKAGLTSAKANYNTAVDNYDDAKNAENNLYVTAPCSGTIWTLDLAVGDSVSAGSGGSSGGSTVGGTTGTSSSSSGLTIARDSELAVLLAVNEVDVPALKVGQSVDVAFDALPDFTVTGKVDAIASKGAVNQGVVTYDVWISLDVTDPKLKTGMSASATIVTAVARDALLVPNAAVKTNEDDATKYVQVMDAGASAPRDVTIITGLKGDSETVVLSGLKSGDKVVTKTTEGSSGQDASSGDSGSGGMMLPGMDGPPR